MSGRITKILNMTEAQLLYSILTLSGRITNVHKRKKEVILYSILTLSGRITKGIRTTLSKRDRHDQRNPSKSLNNRDRWDGL